MFLDLKLLLEKSMVCIHKFSFILIVKYSLCGSCCWNKLKFLSECQRQNVAMAELYKRKKTIFFFFSFFSWKVPGFRVHRPFCVEFAGSLPSAWVLSRYSSFLSQFKDVRFRETGDLANQNCPWGWMCVWIFIYSHPAKSSSRVGSSRTAPTPTPIPTTPTTLQMNQDGWTHTHTYWSVCFCGLCTVDYFVD